MLYNLALKIFTVKYWKQAPDKERIFNNMFFSLFNPMFEHLLKSSHRDDSNKWSNMGFGEEIS